MTEIHVHVMISGFRQDQSRIHGMIRLSETLHDHGFNNGASRVLYRPWNADFRACAEWLFNVGQLHKAAVRLNVCGYSWGGGWGAMQLAKECRDRGITVDFLTLCDAVYRHKWFKVPSLLRRGSMFAPKIRLPSNVLVCQPYHQTIDIPQGHEVVPGSGFKGKLNKSIQLHASHSYCDEQAEVHDKVIEYAHALKRSRLPDPL